MLISPFSRLRGSRLRGSSLRGSPSPIWVPLGPVLPILRSLRAILDSGHKIRHQFIAEVRSDIGSVEAALVMIPTILLFLGVLQIGGNVLSQAVSSNQVQGIISKSALLSSDGLDSAASGSSALSSASNAQTSALSIQKLALPGGGNLIVGEQVESAPTLSPLIVGHNKYISSGVAVDENP